MHFRLTKKRLFYADSHQKEYVKIKAVRTIDWLQREMEVSMKKKLFIILTGVLVLSLALVGIVNAEKSPTLFLDAPAEEEGDENELICSYEKSHPVLKRLSEQYEVSYEDLVDYFCHDYDIGVGEIRLALATAKIIDDEQVTYETLLEMFIGGMDWGEIWQEYGLIGFGKGEDKDDQDLDEDDDEEDMVEVGEDLAVNSICSGEMDHPVLLSLAEEYDDVDYETLLTYFCENKFGIGEIKNALKVGTMEDVEESWEDLLDERLSEDGGKESGWGLIWQRLGLIGKDKQENEGDEPDILEKFENKNEKKNNQGKPENHPGKGKGHGNKP